MNRAPTIRPGARSGSRVSGKVQTRAVGLVATLGMLGCLVGLPWVLMQVGVLPQRMPESWAAVGTALQRPDDGSLLLFALTLIAWAAWVFFALTIMLELLCRMRGVRVPRLPGLTLPQTGARGLVGAAALLFVAGPAVSGAATASQTLTSTTSLSTASGQVQVAPTIPTPAEHLVQPGESLWSIAQDLLGSGARYPELFAATTHLIQPDGRSLQDPNRIYPGWRILLPQNQTLAPRSQAPAPKTSAPVRPPTPQSSHRFRAQPESQPTPTVSPATSLKPAPAAAANAGRELEQHSWTLLGLTGGGLILAGSLHRALRRKRIAQLQARRPGRMTSAPPPELTPIERTLAQQAPCAGPTVEFMDQVLRRMCSQLAAPMPSVAAVELGPELVLHLSTPADLPPPWQATPDRMHWAASAELALPDFGALAPDQPAPYPLLVTIGTGSDDALWLLNLEEFAVINLTGDPIFREDFLRYLVAELALNPWSGVVTVDCVGTCAEIAPMNPVRVRWHPDAQSSLIQAFAEATEVVERATGTDVVSARAGGLGDPWPARVVVLDHASLESNSVDLRAKPALSELSTEPKSARLDELLGLLRTHPGRTGTALITLGSTPNGVEITITNQGRVQLLEAGLDLVAVGLTPDEAQGCAALLAQADDLSDQQIPGFEQGSVTEPIARQSTTEPIREDWRSFANQAGAVLPELTQPRPEEIPTRPELVPEQLPELATDPATSQLEAQPVSLLPEPDATYLRSAATTVSDLRELSPTIPAQVRDRIHEADPFLDEDLAAWHHPKGDRPRLWLLGPVQAQTHGDQHAVARRRAYYTELLAYLSTRPHGATPAQVADALGISVGRVRTDVKAVRDWLGINPQTGMQHLPDALKSAAARAQGVGVYQVEGLLTDADLFRRLRLRGQARGPAGLDDLRAALELVTGQPFDRLRPTGWTWLFEGDRIDHHLSCAIVDTAHIVTTAALASGDLDQAQTATEVALAAAPYEHIPQLDHAALLKAQGHSTAANNAIFDLCNPDGETPDLPTRTAALIRPRPQQRAAS